MANRNKASLGLSYKKFWFWNAPNFIYSSAAPSYLGPVKIILETEYLLLYTFSSELLCHVQPMSLKMNSDGFNACWVCLEMCNNGFLVFLLQQQSQGQIPGLDYLKLFLKKERERQLYEWEWGWCKVSSDNGFLLGRWGEWASQMDIDLQQLGCEDGVGRWVWTTPTAAVFPWLTLFSW